jgi:hypothetical protein
MNTLGKTLLAATAAFGVAVSSHAAPILVIFDDSSLVAVTDNGAGDNAAGLGEISWSNSSFGIWDLVVSGVTAGSIGYPTLQLSISASSAAGGFLGVYYGDTDFAPTNSGVAAAISGSLASGEVENWTYFFAGNDVSDPGYYTSVLTNALHSSSPFVGLASSSLSADVPYGLVNAVYLTTTSGGSSSIDASLSVPDTASTAALLGIGLLGLGVMARRQKLA